MPRNRSILVLENRSKVKLIDEQEKLGNKKIDTDRESITRPLNFGLSIHPNSSIRNPDSPNSRNLTLGLGLSHIFSSSREIV